MKDGARNEAEIFNLPQGAVVLGVWEGGEKQLLPLVASERKELERVALAER